MYYDKKILIVRKKIKIFYNIILHLLFFLKVKNIKNAFIFFWI